MIRLAKCLQRSFVALVCLGLGYLFYCKFSETEILMYKPGFNYTCRENSVLFRSSDSILCFDKPHIFFVETSSSAVLNSRQACAIESTAKNNPSSSVAVLMTPTKSIDSTDLLMKILKNISNVEFIRIDIGYLTEGTPIQNWYLQGQWKKSEWKASHLSDALRYFLMWKYGGMYLDMDIVTLRSLEKLKNTVITENWDRVAAGILFFDKGHELMKRCMNDFANNYDYSNFVMNGPGIITKNIKSLCDVEDTSKVSGANCGIDVQPPESAFPIPYSKWEDYFTPTSVTNIKQYFNSSYLMHVWNKVSKYSKLWVGTKSLYEQAMIEHCPKVYRYSQSRGYL